MRARRRSLRLTQARLADGVGLSSQQIQKYERGTSRVSASKLYEIAMFLSVPAAYFFDGLPSLVDGSDPTNFAPARSNFERLIEIREGRLLAELFPRITSARRRRAVVRLVRAIAGENQ